MAWLYLPVIFVKFLIITIEQKWEAGEGGIVGLCVTMVLRFLKAYFYFNSYTFLKPHSGEYLLSFTDYLNHSLVSLKAAQRTLALFLHHIQ